MVRASTVRDDVGFGLLPIVSHSGLAGRPACLFTVAACLFAVAVLFCVSSAHGQVIEEGGFPVKGGGVSGESFSLSCPSRLVVEAGESVLLSCSATAVPEEGVRYGWESVSGDGLRLLSDANERSPLFTAPFSGESAEYVYRLTAMSVGVYETATVTVIVGGVLGETVSAPVVREECGSFGGFGRDQEGCQPWNKAPPQDPFGDSPEDDGIVPWPSFPEGPGAEDKDFPGSSGGDSAFRTAPRLECPVAVFLEELETGSIECHVSDAAGEEHLEYAWEPVGSTTRNYLDNPRLIPEDSPHPSVIAPEAPSYETLESFRSGDRAFRYRYRLTATSRATGLSSHAEVEVFVSSSRPVVYCPLEVSVEEGETARLDCEGADPLSFRMEYDEEAASVLWEWEGLWGTSTAPLDATDLSSPLFTAPAGSAGEEYHYIASMTLSASGVRRTARRRVTVTIVSTEETEEALAVASKASAPSVECEDVAIYEATDGFPLDCEAQEVPDGATYSWTARGSTSGTSELSSMTELTPMFDVPVDIIEPDEANKDYEYMVKMTVGGVAQDSADITVTVLEKPNISCSNTSIAFLRGIAQYGAFAGETRTMTPCFGEFRGAPEGSNYVFTWISADVSGLVVSCTRSETRCVTGGVALAALDRTDRPTATWTAPSGSPWPGEYLQYVYSFRVSAPNADPLTLGPTGLAPNENLPRSKLSITCEDYAYESYAGGSPDFWDMDCQASGAWFGYTVTWKWDPPTFFTGHDTGTPRYDIPSQVRRDTTFTYTVSVSAPDHDPGEATIAIRVFSTNPTIACSDHTVYEAASDFNLNCRLTFHPPFHPDFATFNWTGTDVAGRLRNTDSVTPRFVVPPNVDADTDYKYTLTMSGPDIFDVTENVAVTVKDRSDITVTCADPGSVYEGAADVAFSCSASGAPPGSYAWSWDPATFLTGHDTGTPTFAVPDVERNTMYTYTVTASATGARSPPVDVKVTVLNKSALSVACTHADTEVYEGAENFALDCEASGAPGDDPQYTYAWTGDATALALLDANDIASPTFSAPDEVTSDETYEYVLTVSAENSDDATAEVEVTVLNKKTLIVFCAVPASVFEGSGEVLFDCNVSGAPGDDPQYTYAWTGEVAAMALLDANDIASPTFSPPPAVDEARTYRYTLTVSAPNADETSLDVAITVLNKRALSVACTNADTEVYEGAENFALDCEASGAPGDDPQYTYAWTGDAAALALLDANDIASPTFSAPPAVDEAKTYRYTLTVSAQNADDATAEVEVTVLNKKTLIVFCAVPASVFEGSGEVLFDCNVSGAPGDDPQYTYAWTGEVAAMALLDANDIASPTFSAPPAVDEARTYRYTLTVSAPNADETSLDVAITVLNKRALSVACTNADTEVYEGAENFALDCEASGAPGDDPQYTYAWTGDAAALALLDANDIASPTFSAPPAVDEARTYRYTLTVSAENADTHSVDVTLRVLKKGALAIACTIPLSVYEGAENVLFDCEASGAPGDDPQYTYAWTGEAAALALLDANDIASPTFSPPPAVDEARTYRYTLTVSAPNADETSLDVAITVLNKRALSVACTNADTEVYEGAENFALDCEASGAPGDDPQYTYAWTGDATALALLDANDIASPTFSAPDEVTSDETYEYVLTVSAENSDDATLDVAITVLNKGALAVVCTAPDSVYEGSENVPLGCEASGAPGANPVYTYAWTGDAAALALLDANDIASPTFSVPVEVTSDETYEYTLTVSAQNAGDASLDVAITVLNKKALTAVCTNAFAEVYEATADFELNCEASGASGNDPEYTYAWTARGSTLDTSLLSAADIRAPLFHVPDAVSSDETYEYTLTVSAQNAGDTTAEVAVTVLNKKTLVVFCAVPASVFEGSGEVLFDCSASGAPGIDPVYTYAWTGDATAMALLDANDIATPTFSTPDAVDQDKTYRYAVTVSAEHSDTHSLDVTLRVLKAGALSITCTIPVSVYEGAGDVFFDCSASGAPAGSTYEYAWAGDATAMALLDANDIATPTFSTPDEVSSDEMYAYTVTVSAQNVDDDARLYVAITVLKRRALAVACKDPAPVYEGSGEVLFDCSASGAPAGAAYEYAWTARGATPDVSLLSAADVASPTFHVPDKVDATTTYEYLLTASAENAEDATSEVTVTVLKRGALAVVCTDPSPVYEGSADIAFDCSASGAPPGSEYAYVWTARGDTQDTSLLSAADVASPTFHVPAEVDGGETYEYTLTASAENAEDGSAEVTVTVLNKGAPAVVCTDPGLVYEGSDDIALDCSASGAPGDSPRYAYVWTARGDTQDTSLLSATDIASPTFHVPAEVDGDETYEYTLTASAENAEDGSAEVTVTVLNKGAPAVVCTYPGSVYEGSDDITLDCSASGAPAGSRYDYVWTARGDTQDTSLLSAADVASPTFHVPAEVGGGETYEYLLTVSAENAEDGSAEVTVTVLDKPVLAVACAGPYSLYEGSEDFAFDCSASGAPGDDPQYTYVWTARGDTQDTSLLSGTDGPAATFLVPDDLPETVTYEYLLTASAENAEDNSAEVSVTVMHPAPLAFVDDTIADRVYVFTVGETIEDIVLPGAKGGFPPYAYTFSPALPPGLAFDDQARTISGTPSEVRPPRGYAWQVSDADAGSVSLAFFIEVAPVPSPATESLSPEPEALSLSAITTSVSPLRFGVQASNTQVVLDPTTDRITTHIAGPYHTGRMTLSADGDREPLASAEEIALSVELTSPVLLRREGETVEPAALALSPSWSYTESCEGIPSQSLGGLYTELLLSEGDCPLLLFGGELDLVDALPGRYEGVMDVIIRQGETEETRTLEVDVTVVPAQRVITIGPGGVRFNTSRELSAGLTEEQNLSIYPDVAFLNAGKPHEAFELSNPSLIPLEVSVSARFGYTEATADGREVVVEDIKDSRLGDLSSAVDIHPSLLVLQPGEKGLVRYGIREEALSSLTGKGYAAFFDIVSSPRQYVDQDRLPEEVADDRTARVTMRVPGLYVPGDGASRLQAELLSITEGVSLSATFLVETLDGPFMGEVIAYDGEGRELGRREALVYTRSRVRVPLSRKPDEDVVFLRFSPRGAGRVPEPVSIRWNAPPADIGDAENKARRRILEKFAQQP